MSYGGFYLNYKHSGSHLVVNCPEDTCYYPDRDKIMLERKIRMGILTNTYKGMTMACIQKQEELKLVSSDSAWYTATEPSWACRTGSRQLSDNVIAMTQAFEVEESGSGISMFQKVG